MEDIDNVQHVQELTQNVQLLNTDAEITMTSLDPCQGRIKVALNAVFLKYFLKSPYYPSSLLLLRASSRRLYFLYKDWQQYAQTCEQMTINVA